MTGADVSRSRFFPHVLTLVVLLVLTAAAIGSAIAARNLVQDQEEKLLRGQGQAAGSVLVAGVQSVQTTLAAAAALAAQENPDRAAIDAVAAPLRSQSDPPQFAAAALVEVAEQPRVVREILEGLDDDDFGDVARQETLDAAVGCDPTAVGICLVSSRVFESAGDRRLAFALGAPAVPEGRAMYYEVGLGPITASPNDEGAFTDVEVVLYAAPGADPAQVVVTTNGATTLSGDVVHEPLPVGTSSWDIAITAKGSLVGGFADNMPWILLGGGLLVAFLVAAVVETLARRRERVQEQVTQRTAELTQSLEDLAAAQEQLIRSERLSAIGELTSTIGHELRNPLGVLTNSLYLLRQRIEPQADERVLRQLATADREVAAATLIVSDLLEFARARDPILEPVDLDDLLEEVDSVAPAPTGVAVTRTVDPATGAALADRNQLRQVLLNLVTNAYQAMPEGGTVTITGRPAGSEVEISVADSGIGMSEETRARIFEPFFTTKERGVGLGLAVTRRLVDTHNGSIEVSSREGGGTTFTIRLPSAATEPARAVQGADA